MTGVKGRSGRHLSATTIVHRAYELVDARLPELFQVLIDKALAGDREAAIYLIDRVMGRPKLEVEQRVTGRVSLTADDYAVLARAAALEARTLRLVGPAIEANAKLPE